MYTVSCDVDSQGRDCLKIQYDEPWKRANGKVEQEMVLMRTFHPVQDKIFSCTYRQDSRSLLVTYRTPGGKWTDQTHHHVFFLHVSYDRFNHRPCTETFEECVSVSDPQTDNVAVRDFSDTRIVLERTNRMYPVVVKMTVWPWLVSSYTVILDGVKHTVTNGETLLK